MIIVINHLTRMRPGAICVAGMDAEYRHVRPVLKRGQWSTASLRKNGGVFDVGSVVELLNPKSVGSPPEMEDRETEIAEVRFLRDTSPGKLWKALKVAARPTSTAIFGDALTRRFTSDGLGATMDVGKGRASLGCLSVTSPVSIRVKQYEEPKARIQFSDGQFAYDLMLTDARFYEPDKWTLRQAIVHQVNERLQNRKVEVILSVGLTRPFKRKTDKESRHWLQVNNLHLSDNPLWQMQ